MRKILVIAAVTIAGSWLALCVLAWAFQEKLIFFPGPAPIATPHSVGLDFERVTLTAADGVQLDAWWIPAAKADRKLLVCHGNAGSIEGRLELARNFVAWGWSTLLFDYRGYGASAGSPSVAGVALDADAACDWLMAKDPGLPLILWGESLGGGVAAELSTRRRADTLILESTFTSIADLGGSSYPFLPVRWLLRADLDARAALSEATCAVFLLHGRRDAVVPFEHALRNFDAAREPKQLCEFQGGHNDRGWAGDARAVEQLRRFVAR